MADINHIISLGIGSPAAIAEFITFGLQIQQAETIVEEETVDAGVTTGDLTLPSWTPDTDELVLVALSCRDKSLSPTIAGNGYTFELVESVQNVQEAFKMWLWRAMKDSPSTGSIVITLPGNTKPAVAVATRFSSVYTEDDNNGAGAVEVNGTNSGPDPDDEDMFDSIVTKTDGAWAYAAGSHRLRTFTVPAEETALAINVTAGESGDITKLSCWYEGPITPAGTVQLGEANDLSSDHDWAMILAGIKPGATTPPFVVAPAERTYIPAYESRTYIIPAEPRTITIPAENRTITA